MRANEGSVTESAPEQSSPRNAGAESVVASSPFTPPGEATTPIRRRGIHHAMPLNHRAFRRIRSCRRLVSSYHMNFASLYR